MLCSIYGNQFAEALKVGNFYQKSCGNVMLPGVVLKIIVKPLC